MFEKEAEDAVKRIRCFDCMGYSDCLENNKYYSCNVFKEAIKNWKDGFQKGAEFGYNKALEEATHNYNAIIADYDKRIAELEKENAELKGQVEMSYEVYNNNLDYSYHIEEQLTEAKELLKRWVDDKVYTVSEQKDLIADTEQFLKGAVNGKENE